ncbi:MAG: NAD-dependent protein deacylase [Microvirga sp.]|nr:NAD-dependent protein deacylase [Microvirga sp.]
MRIFVLTGAGVSAESGLGTFRDAGGMWRRFDPMKLATPEAFARDPDLVHAFYDARRANLLTAEPNAAHAALARLEAGLAERGGDLFLCTQNIDDLHERAGSTRVAHMHGELLKARCLACGETPPWRADLGVAAAGFVSQARALGIRTCEINLEPSDNARLFDERRYGPASEAVPAFVEAALRAR